MAEQSIQDMDEKAPKNVDPCNPQSIRDLKQTLINQFPNYEESFAFDVGAFSQNLYECIVLGDNEILLKYLSWTPASLVPLDTTIYGDFDINGPLFSNGNIIAYNDPIVLPNTSGLRRKDIHKPMWKYLNEHAPRVDNLEERFRKSLHDIRYIKKRLGG